VTAGGGPRRAGCSRRTLPLPKRVGDPEAGRPQVPSPQSFGETADGGFWCPHCHVPVFESDAFCRSCRATLDFGGPAIHRPEPIAPAFSDAAQSTAPTTERRGSRFDRPGELRILTMMFANLVESTALATRVDAEDFREVIVAVQRCVTGVANRFGGRVSSDLGDGALICFGYPIALEDHAERAVQAGLALIEEMVGLTLLGGYRPKVTVGVATGLVVIGEVPAGFGRTEQMLAGESANLAARLMSVAEPNSVLISSTTQQLAAGFFEYQGPLRLSLKGFPGPILAWRPLRASNAEGRFQALRARNLTPLVGRDQEVEKLAELWALASRGAGQVAAIVGEPGIGKSRLAIELQERVRTENHLAIRYSCSPDRDASPLQPIRDTIERGAGFEISDPPALRMAKLKRMLAPFLADPRVNLSLIAELLSLPGGGVESLTPQQRKEQTLTALLAIIETLADRRPLLLCFEDAHWSDPTSLELLGLLIARAPRLNVLVLVTARPEFVPDWRDHPAVTSLVLARLDQGKAAKMLEQIPGAAGIGANVRRDILARADGVPLFLEELAKTVLERGAAHEPRRDRPQPIPASIHASLLARLDRLGEVRKVAQTAAAIGRDFSISVLAAVTGFSSASLHVALDTLTSAQLVTMIGPPSAGSYRFKHVLVQDAAYSSMLRRQRQRLHRRIVNALENNFSEIVLTQPDMVARHCASAQLTEKAIAYWLKAGNLAQSRAAMTEAATAFGEGLQLLGDLRDGCDRDRIELELKLALSRSEIATKGYAAQGVGEALTEARRLCERLAHPPELVSVLYGLWTHALMRTELRQAEQVAEEILRLGQARRIGVWTARGCRLAGLTCIARGQYEAARRHLERGLELYDPGESGRRSSFILYDPQVMLRTFLGIALFELGFVERARAGWRAALAEARRSKHRFTLPYALTQPVMADLEIDDFESALLGAEELVAHSEENEVSFFWGIGMIFRGRCLVARGRADEGFRQIEVGLSASRKTHATLWLPSQLALIADAYGAVGRPEEGLKRLEEATRLIAGAGEHYAASTVYRVRGELLMSLGHDRKGAASLQQALTIARRQGARVLQLRAALSLAQRRRAQGAPGAERDLIGALLSQEIESLDAPAFREARTLASRVCG
jgi:class 3 adenylate cyclase/tetratricopeptide (TPR) repeat protein